MEFEGAEIEVTDEEIAELQKKWDEFSNKSRAGVSSTADRYSAPWTTIEIPYDDDIIEVPFGFAATEAEWEYESTPLYRRLKRKQQQKEDKSRSRTSAKIQRWFDQLQAEYPEIDIVRLAKLAASQNGLPVKVSSLFDLELFEDRTITTVARLLPVTERPSSASSTVALASVSDKWTFIGGEEKGIRQKVFNGRILLILTD